jgi:hypothetical protein
MSRMRRFTHDVETVELTERELSIYSSLVQSACHISEQHKVSCLLAAIPGPQPTWAQDYAISQVDLMWRSEARL